MIEIGGYIYSDETRRRLNLPYFRGIESMISERINMNYMLILITTTNNREYSVTIEKWYKSYNKEDFNRGKEVFVEQVILDYTFGVTD